jgi:hypothetical protein
VFDEVFGEVRTDHAGDAGDQRSGRVGRHLTGLPSRTR